MATPEEFPPRGLPETHLVTGQNRLALCRREHAQLAPNDGKIYQSVPKNYTTTCSHLINAPLAAPANSLTRHSPGHAFPIRTVGPTQLTAWEDFQRGPPPVHVEILHSGPGRRSFTIEAFDVFSV